MPHHSKKRSKASKASKRSKQKNRSRPTLKHNAYRIVRHNSSKRPQRSMRNIHYTVLPLLPKNRSHQITKKNHMNMEATRASIARKAKSAIQERKEAEEAQREQERYQKEQEKAERAFIRQAKQEKKAAHSAAVTDLDDLFSRMAIKPDENMY